MATQFFGILTSDIQAKQNPKNDPNLFQIGDGDGQYPTAQAEAKAAEWDDYVASRIPEKYRAMLQEVQGHIVVEYAADGMTVSVPGKKTKPLLPIVSGTMTLYKNYFQTYRQQYSLRNISQAMDPADFTVDLATGVITFTAGLKKGDMIIADYEHGAAAQLTYLRRIVLGLICAEITEELSNYAGNTTARVDDMQKQAYGDLDRLKRGEAGLQLFDQLFLVDEYETRNGSNALTIATPGGYL